jgi:hypothetical protein
MGRRARTRGGNRGAWHQQDTKRHALVHPPDAEAVEGRGGRAPRLPGVARQVTRPTSWNAPQKTGLS